VSFIHADRILGVAGTPLARRLLLVARHAARLAAAQREGAISPPSCHHRHHLATISPLATLPPQYSSEAKQAQSATLLNQLHEQARTFDKAAPQPHPLQPHPPQPTGPAATGPAAVEARARERLRRFLDHMEQLQQEQDLVIAEDNKAPPPRR